MTRTALLVLLLALPATTASALSCLRPDAVRLFETARDAKESYYVVRGRVTLLETAATPDPESGKPALTRARLTGHALGKEGFATPFDMDITVATGCLAIWCGSADGLDEEMLLAVEATDTGPVLDIGPCRGHLVTWNASGEERLLACYRTGVCEAGEF